MEVCPPHGGRHQAMAGHVPAVLLLGHVDGRPSYGPGGVRYRKSLCPTPGAPHMPIPSKSPCGLLRCADLSSLRCLTLDEMRALGASGVLELGKHRFALQLVRQSSGETA